MPLLHAYCAEVAGGNEAPIAARFARAKRDPVGTLLASAVEAGVRFRWSGATLLIEGTERLSDRDQILLHRHDAQIIERLAEPGGDGADLLGQLEVWVEVITTPADAARVISELPASCGLDCETTAKPEYRVEPPWLVITKRGERAKHQPEPEDRSGLDPYKARVRMLQVYSPEHPAAFLFDLNHVPLETLHQLGLWRSRKFVAHNAAFEATMLRAHERGIELIDSMQLAGLVLGCEFGSRTLSNVSRQILGVELSKEQQFSDWGAEHLSVAQVNYAAGDAVVCYRAARAMWRELGPPERRAFEVQNAAVPVVARMRLTGCPFVAEIHRKTIRKWELEHAEERARFKELTGTEPQT